MLGKGHVHKTLPWTPAIRGELSQLVETQDEASEDKEGGYLEGMIMGSSISDTPHPIASRGRGGDGNSCQNSGI